MTRAKEEIGLKWVRQQVAEYKRVLPRYTLYAKVLQQVLEQAATKHAPRAIVQTRAKSVTSFADKILRKQDKHRNPVKQITDLCGARVITHTPDEVRAIGEFIEKHFNVDWDNTIDVSQRLKPAEFGYRSVHYVVQFKPNTFPTKDIDIEISEKVLPDKTPSGHPMRAEIQVRTILEHAWADFAHEVSYKSSFTIPEKWQRELAEQAALLEEADEEFSRIKDGLQTYASTYGVYMTEKQIQDEIKRLEIVLKYDPDNAEIAHRVGKLAITLGNWSKAIEVLSKYVGSGYQPILRDLGVALCKKHKPRSRGYRKGQKYLEAASSPPNKDADAIASLAGTWKGIDDGKVRELYCQAFELDPTDPYPLENYLTYEIIHRRDISLVTCMGPVIRTAIQRCRDQADVGMNLPWAFYSMGKFYLLLGKSYESLAAYAKAIQLSTAAFMIETSLCSLDNLRVVQDKLPGYEWIRRLLLVGLATKFPDEVSIAQVKELASKGRKAIQGPVVIVAGGCDVSVEQQMKSYHQTVLEIFRGFRGTIISGGTTAGVSGLIGDVQRQYPDTIRTIGYVPRLTPAEVSVDKRYSEIRYTEGDGFSALEPLQNWIDIIGSGISPSQVKLLAINGGIVAAAEYRIALALGGRVAVVEESGREAARLLQDTEWGTSETLMHLPADPMILRVFIGPGKRKLEPDDVRETIARVIHETYRKMQASQRRSPDPSMAEWEKLMENLKESNRQQADHIDEKLRQIGCTIHKVEGSAVSLIKFTDSEIETMAEMEHARWTIERLLIGWTWGEEKDVIKKTNPYLVPWSELSDEVKEWDRETVRKIPQFLAKVGFEARRKR